MGIRFGIIISIFVSMTAQELVGQSDYRFSTPGSRKLSLTCEVSQNLIIIPARINNSSNLKLVLDTGINSTIITGLSTSDTIPLNTARKIRVAGLGDGTSIEAYHSTGNQISIGSPVDTENILSGYHEDVYILASDEFELSRQLGIRVHGLVGSDLFEKMLVEIEPIGKTVTFYDRETFNYRRKLRAYTKIPLTMNQGKPYLDVRFYQEDGSVLDSKLLIDTGASLSFWIASMADSSIRIPSVTFRSLLGQGLNGPITGVNGRVQKAFIGPFELKNPLVSYPDSASIAGLKLNRQRHGSIGNDVLRRFTVIFDFQDSALYLKPNRWFNNSFTYNRSGMEVEKIDPFLPIYSIYFIIPGSPAEQAGLKPGDIIEYINNQPTGSMNLDDINSVLYGSNGRVVLLRIDRNGIKYKVKFTLATKI